MTYTYFNVENEFSCKHCGKNHMDPDFVRRLDIARGYAGVPFVITSGYRCMEHDKAVGGAGNHPTGKAADIRCLDNTARLAIVTGLIRAGIKRIGVGGTFIHADMCEDRPQGVLWLYG